MSEALSIKEPGVNDSSFDLELLKDEGLKNIQELAGNNWTDFNFHDPGVTILEILCYALTDLAYRADFDIADLLNTSGRRKVPDTLFAPQDILTTAPVSVLDFKRVILDMEGVKNCDIVPSYLEKVIPGSYDIKVEIHPDYEDASFRIRIKEDILALVMKYRPPGIVFDQVGFLEHDPIGIALDLELTEDIDPKKIFSAFIQCVQNYFSPEIRFRSLQELMDQGMPVDMIFNGPLLDNGFLPDEEILYHSVRQRVFTSDLLSLVMAIPGVSFVRELRLIDSKGEDYNWIYDVKPGFVPRIAPGTTQLTCRYKNTVIFESKPGSLELWSSPKLNRTSSHKQNTLDLAKGISRNLRKYHSIQHDFPETYGIGPKGPSAGADTEKLASIRQFKGYLMIYDQVMANFLAQLDHVKYLFSTEDIETSYAVQLMDEIPGIEALYKPFIENYFVNHSDLSDKRKLKSEWLLFLKSSRDSLTAKIQSSFETGDEFLRRRNAALDHLLARFGMDTLKLELLSGMKQVEAIAYKLDLLRNFPKLSSEKYATGASSVNPEIPGLKAWIGRNLNLKGAHKNTITSFIDDKLNPANPENGFKTEVYAAAHPLDTLLKNASEKENIQEGAQDEVAIYDRSNEVVARIAFDDPSQPNKTDFVHRKLLELDRESENFLVIDHMFIRPSEDMPCFGFNVLGERDAFFISERRYTLAEAEKFSEEFTRLCQEKENFKVVESALKEFRIRFSCSFGNLLTRAYYSSPAEAKEQLDYFLDALKNETPRYSFSTKYEDHYINVSNPFSYIITVLFPSWPSKFQKEGFKKYVEEYLYQELPAHLVVNIKWLDFTAMKEAEQHWENYQRQSVSRNALPQMNALDKLMEMLVS